MVYQANQPVRTVLVEDHRATRLALCETLEEFSGRVKIVATFPDAESMLKSLGDLLFDVVLVDLRLPGMSGIELVQALGRQSPQTRALALTVFDDEGSVLEMLSAGAFGYLLKDEPTVRLAQAIEEAASGQHPISSRVAGFLFTHAKMHPSPSTLSDREMELALFLAKGLSYSECADGMGIKLGTVQDYVKNLYRKLGVNSKKEVMAWVTRCTAKN